MAPAQSSATTRAARPLDMPRIPRAAVIGIGVFLLTFAVVRNLDVDVTWIHWLASDTA